jgi:hypothetical protein
MKRGPQGQKRPADAVSAAVMIGKIATGQIEDTKRDPKRDYTSKAGIKGGKARAKTLSPTKRSMIAKKAAKTRWDVK